MKLCFMLRGLQPVLSRMAKPGLDKAARKAIGQEYRAILLRAKDIGSGNTLLMSYGLMAYFIAMNRKGGLTPEQNLELLAEGFRHSKLIRFMLGDAKSYFSEQHMEMRRKWSRETYQRKYENDWVVDVLEGNGDYRFGFDYRECGACKLARDEGCPELAKYLCRLDFLIVEIIGVHLKRTGTLAEGCDKCDFRFYD